jgi:hypothetical protein
LADRCGAAVTTWAWRPPDDCDARWLWYGAWKMVRHAVRNTSFSYTGCASRFELAQQVLALRSTVDPLTLPLRERWLLHAEHRARMERQRQRNKSREKRI